MKLSSPRRCASWSRSFAMGTGAFIGLRLRQVCRSGGIGWKITLWSRLSVSP
jgi:hypothetical protein